MDSSPLNKLPAELRNKVFELVLVSPSDIDVTTLYSTIEDKPSPVCLTPVNLALTATCRQIRADTVAVFYAMNIFYFAPEEVLLDRQTTRDPRTFQMKTTERYIICFNRLARWIHGIGDTNASYIRKLCMDGGIISTLESARDMIPNERWTHYLRMLTMLFPQLTTRELRVVVHCAQFPDPVVGRALEWCFRKSTSLMYEWEGGWVVKKRRERCRFWN